MVEIDWNHQEHLRQWAVLAAQGHAGAMDVVNHWGLTLPPVPAPLPRVVVPQAPRPPAPAPAQTPALAGIENRTAVLQNLLSRPAPTDLT
jgi:hypothetical protein